MRHSERKVLRSLIIGKDDAHVVDFSFEPCNDVALVTPRHAVQTMGHLEGCVERRGGRYSFALCMIFHDSIRRRAIGMKEKCMPEVKELG